MERDYDVLKVELDKIADIGLDNYLMFEYSNERAESAGLTKSERTLLDRASKALHDVEDLRQDIEDDCEFNDSMSDEDDAIDELEDLLSDDDEDDDHCDCCYCRAQAEDDED